MVSIIIPVYRSEQTLERCINSVCAQTYTDWEAIMIVDGPPDASGRLADTLAKKDERIRVIHQENQGVSAARNTGIKHAKGTFIEFLDSDDYLEPHALAVMEAAMQAAECDMVIAGFHHLYFGRDIVKLPSMSGTYRCKENRAVFLQLYQEQFLNMPWNKWYRKELIQQGFPLHMNLGEDLLFNIAYMRNIRAFCVIQEPVYDYIQDERGTTLSTKHREDRIQTAFCLYDAVHDFCVDIWGKAQANETSILSTKVAVEFLDAMEGLAFETELKRKEKLEIIQTYCEAWRKMEDKIDALTKVQANLHLLDYKIIFYFFTREKIKSTYLMIVLRGIIVKWIRRVTCSH